MVRAKEKVKQGKDGVVMLYGVGFEGIWGKNILASGKTREKSGSILFTVKGLVWFKKKKKSELVICLLNLLWTHLDDCCPSSIFVVTWAGNKMSGLKIEGQP